MGTASFTINIMEERMEGEGKCDENSQKKEYMYEGRSICNEKAFITPSINAFRFYTRSKLVLYFIFLTY